MILDLSGVTFCDSSGLNTLLRLRRHDQKVSSHLVLVAPPRQMMRLLTVTGAGSILDIHNSLAEAWAEHPGRGIPPIP
ncbi:STAS domain-containing protein [Streptomyces sp. NPDC005132]|uniref:STAS domain-containing protein n=1 Tax=Streptomyces sp. NPDC005132 TaxID=3154294 RepID=UPI0033BEA576